MPAEPLSSYAAMPAAARPARSNVPLTWSRFRYPQSLYKYGAVLATLAFVAYALDYLKIEVDRLPGLLGRVWETLSTRYYPPNVGHVLQPDYLRSVVETLQMSYLATVVGLAIAVPLAWFASFNMHSTPEARRVAVGNFFFKLTGCVLVLPFLHSIGGWLAAFDPDAQRQVVNFHLAFNVAIALTFIGFTEHFARLAESILPSAPEYDSPAKPRYLDPVALETPALAVSCAAREALRLGDMPIVKSHIRRYEPVASNR